MLQLTIFSVSQYPMLPRLQLTDAHTALFWCYRDEARATEGFSWWYPVQGWARGPWNGTRPWDGAAGSHVHVPHGARKVCPWVNGVSHVTGRELMRLEFILLSSARSRRGFHPCDQPAGEGPSVWSDVLAAVRWLFIYSNGLSGVCTREVFLFLFPGSFFPAEAPFILCCQTRAVKIWILVNSEGWGFQVT